ncbi:MAG: TonB-dependent receptor [Saprospirales bacterium]|nr:TonB-dependent receptor [Saprospirales bacterium]
MKTPTLLPAASLLVFLLACQTSFAQSVRILVTDEENMPLIGANIQLTDLQDSTSLFSVTDVAGMADLHCADGQYRLQISYVGYTPLDDTIGIDDNHRQMRFTLTEGSVALNSVTVTAKRPLITQDGDKMIVDPEPLVSISSNTLEVLEAVPGLFVDPDGGIFLNNMTPAQIYINGREQRMSQQDMAGILRGLPPGTIQRIEIIRTPSTKYDAASSGGIINIVLKKGMKLGRYGSVNAGMNQGIEGDRFAGFNLNNGGNKGSWYINANYHRHGREETASLFRRLSADYNLDQDTRANDWSHQGNIGYGASVYFSEKLELAYDGRVNANLGRNDSKSTNLIFGETLDTLSRIENYVEDYSPSLNLQQDLGLTWKLDTLDGAWENKFSYSYRDGKTEQDFRADILFPELDPVVGEGLNRQGRHFFQFQSDLTYNFPHQTKLETGVKAAYQHYDSRADYYLRENGVLVPDDRRTNAFVYRENLNAAYIHTSRPLVAALLLKTGVRLEHTWMQGRQTVPGDTSFLVNRVDLFPYVYLSRPIMKIASFRLDAYLIYRRTIDRPGYSDLNPYVRYIDEFSYEAGNPGLQPQFTHNIEANISFEDRPLFAIGRNYTDGIRSNVLYPDSEHPEIVVRTYDNVGKSRETYFRAVGAIPPGGVYFFVAGAQYNLNEYEGVYQGEPLSFRRGTWRFFTFHSLNLTKTTRFNLSGFLQLNGLMNFYELETLGQLNLSLSQYFLSKNFRFRFSPAMCCARGRFASTSIRETYPWTATATATASG